MFQSSINNQSSSVKILFLLSSKGARTCMFFAPIATSGVFNCYFVNPISKGTRPSPYLSFSARSSISHVFYHVPHQSFSNLLTPSGLTNSLFYRINKPHLPGKMKDREHLNYYGKRDKIDSCKQDISMTGNKRPPCGLKPPRPSKQKIAVML